MDLTKEEAQCAWAYAYLDRYMAFTPAALQQHDFLGSINGAITQNLGLLRTLKNDGTKHQHAFALALTLAVGIKQKSRLTCILHDTKKPT